MPRSSASLKSRGELAELAFLQHATALGLVVSKPWGETSSYDFIVDAAGQLLRIQVRSVSVAHRGAWRICCTKGRSNKVPLTARDIDLLAAYIFPLDAWYLIPVRAFSPVKTIRLRPGSRGKFEPFCNRWSLLTSPTAHAWRRSHQRCHPERISRGAKRRALSAAKGQARF